MSKQTTQSQFPDHVPIMVEECLDFFSDSQLKIFVDGTLGAAGHAKAILKAHPEIESYIGFDQDKEALELAKKNLEGFGNKILYQNANFSSLEPVLSNLSIKMVDGFFLT